MIQKLIPWRIKKMVADKLPELYYVLNNLGGNPNSLDHWDKKLEKTWNSNLWVWPDKNKLFCQIIENKNDTIIDIGCGNGSVLNFLKENGYSNLHGLELSKYASERLSKEGFTMHNLKLPSIDLPNESYDFIIASEVLEHILNKKLFIKEARRILKSNGKIAIFVPNNCQGPMDEKEHVRQYTSKTLSDFLSGFFKVMKVESFKDSNHSTQFLFALCQKK